MAALFVGELKLQRRASLSYTPLSCYVVIVSNKLFPLTASAWANRSVIGTGPLIIQLNNIPIQGQLPEISADF